MRVSVLAVAVLGLAACSQSAVTNYPTYADATAAGAVARGWVPSFLPVDAHDIAEAHSVDVNQVVVTFKTPDSGFLKSFHSLPQKYHAVARDIFESIDFLGGPPKSGANFFYLCTEEGTGLLTGAVEPENFYYFEPAEEEWTAQLCGK